LRFTPSLTGSYQAKNTAGVLEAIFRLKEKGWRLPEEAVIAGLEHVQHLTGLAGRWQILQTNPLVVADTAHNAEGLAYVLQQAQQAASKGSLFIILGTVSDKDLKSIYTLLPKNAQYFFAEPTVFRKRSADVLAELIKEGAGIEGRVIPDVNQAFSAALAQAGLEDVILITGSNFLIGDLLATH
jgi:dihydrofolate synthase/folylpolyglutamate synthase